MRDGRRRGLIRWFEVMLFYSWRWGSVRVLYVHVYALLKVDIFTFIFYMYKICINTMTNYTVYTPPDMTSAHSTSVDLICPTLQSSRTTTSLPISLLEDSRSPSA